MPVLTAISAIVSTIGSSIDKSNLYYSQRQTSSVENRTSKTMVRNIVLAVVAITVILIFIKLSKSE